MPKYVTHSRDRNIPDEQTDFVAMFYTLQYYLSVYFMVVSLNMRVKGRLTDGDITAVQFFFVLFVLRLLEYSLRYVIILH